MVKQSTQRTPQQQIINTEIYLAFQAEAGRAEMEDKIDQLKQAEQQLTNYKTLPDPAIFKNQVVDFKNRLANTKVPDAFSQNALSSV